MEEEFKLPLRHWLKKQVDSKKFYGLDWANSEKTLIKIPWIQQHYPGWEQSYQLFIAWAKHKESYSFPIDYKKLKGNFRCAMKKSNDFEEIEQQDNLQSGNYKMFRVLDKEEVREKKRQRQIDKKKSTNSRCNIKVEEGTDQFSLQSQTQQSIINPLFITAPETRQEPSNKKNEVSVDHIFNELVNDVANFQRSRSFVESSKSPGSSHQVFSPFSDRFSNISDPYSDTVFNQSVENSPSFSLTSGHTEHTTNRFQQYNPNVFPHSSNYLPDVVEEEFKISRCQQMLSYQLNKYNANLSILSYFEMEIYYNESQISKEIINLKAIEGYAGIRLCYGNVVGQEQIFNMSKKELLSYHSKKMPECYDDRNSAVINKILEHFQQGLVVRYDEESASLVCIRYSESCVSICDREVIELKRAKPVVVRDYENMLNKFEKDGKISNMQCEIVIGTKPHRSKPVKVIFRPVLTQYLNCKQNQNMASISNLSSIYMDQPDSIDVKLEHLKLA